MIPVSKPDINNSDVLKLASVVKSSFVSGGPELEKFESHISAFCRRRYAVAVSNGTSALALALQALNLPKGSKVLLPQFTIISALYAVKSNNLVPVFIEVDKKTWNVSLSSVKNALRSKIDAAIIDGKYFLVRKYEKINTTNIVKAFKKLKKYAAPIAPLPKK